MFTTKTVTLSRENSRYSDGAIRSKVALPGTVRGGILAQLEHSRGLVDNAIGHIEVSHVVEGDTYACIAIVLDRHSTEPTGWSIGLTLAGDIEPIVNPV